MVGDIRLKASCVDSESCLSPSAFGATEVTFRTRQHFRVPRCLRMNGDDTGDDRRVVLDDGSDGVVAVIDGHDTFSGVFAPTFEQTYNLY